MFLVCLLVCFLFKQIFFFFFFGKLWEFIELLLLHAALPRELMQTANETANQSTN